MDDFREWLRKECTCWYLLSQEEQDQYFSRWYDEVRNGKENTS